MQSVADVNGFPHAITAFADLPRPTVADTLDRELACRKMRAIRQQLHWHEKPLYRFASRPDVMNDTAWRKGLDEVRRRGLMFELQVFASQMPDAVKLVRDYADVTFILLHAGMLEDRSEAGWALWRAGMKQLAACPNVMVKLSGLGTFDRACSAERWRPGDRGDDRPLRPGPLHVRQQFPDREAVDRLCEPRGRVPRIACALHPR